jgi:MAF protein
LKKRIYLASGSRQRQALLKLCGIKFKVIIPRVKEERRRGNLSCAGLAKANALAKARAAAKKVKAGVVIAADTLMAQQGKIFGKPKNLAAARRELKSFSGRPQDVYTGLAVIDKDSGKTLLDCEKTRVYMDKLSGAQINRYFSRVSPLDKAGSYDIQGRGAFFVRRIDGCFYNVVGLPLHKLYLILRKLQVKVFFFFLYAICYTLYAVFLAGCSTEYNIVTGQEETYYYSTDKEIQMGEAIAREVEKTEKFAEDPLMQKRVEDIGKRIAAVCDRKDIDYHFYVLDDDEVNAVSLPGGYVYVNKGLVERVANDDELAGVLGHEVGHIVARHSIKKLQAMQGYSLLRVLVAAAPQSGDVGNAADLAFTQLLLGYGREDELLADRLGCRYEKLAGYNPRGMISFLQKLQEIGRRRPEQPKSYFKTHPYGPDRVRVVREELGEKMKFNDYINIEQKQHGQD